MEHYEILIVYGSIGSPIKGGTYKMSVKRRDKKSRILGDGETQCKDSKYRFTFYENGKQKCFYSWRLERTDPLPSGKRECMAFRDKEEELRRSRNRGLAY